MRQEAPFPLPPTLPQNKVTSFQLAPVGAQPSPAAPCAVPPCWDLAGREHTNGSYQDPAQTEALSPPSLGGTLEGTPTPGSPLPRP